MKRFLSILLCVLFVSLGAIVPTMSSAANVVPEQYYPNYKIKGKWAQMIEILENIEASARVGGEFSAGTFSELNNLFAIIFPYFPKSPSNNVIYKQCDLTTRDLISGVTTYKYAVFKERCFTPIGQIVQQIQTKHTVKPVISVKPQQGPAPLNVTLDARGSVDPSNDTIPSDYFFWYFKDIFGVDRPIGKGPVVNWTFSEPGNHIVHLTVRSANRETEGVFDGEKSVSVNVAPESAQIVLYINGRRATPERLTKVGMQNGTATVSLDASATRPTGARTILSHVREITNNQRYVFKQSGDGAPRELNHEFPQQGIYTIKLEVTDNENNKIQKVFQISVSDPVAIIRVKPEAGTTSTPFVFDASTSYSVSSKIRKYQWQVYNPQGNQISLVDAKELKQQFVVPGIYTIKLTVTDIGGAVSTDTLEIQIGSTPPVPSFIVTPTTDLKNPSRFTLDAGGTIDDDLRHGGDVLTYAWTFSSPEFVQIEADEENSQRIIVTMNEPGTYKAHLTVTDKFGESRTIQKDIVVASTLRPEMIVTPLVSARGTEVTFFGRTNKAVVFYERDFGDGRKQQTQDPKVTHTYAKAGIYKVTLRVVNEAQEENILTRQVFAGQKDLPLAAWTVKSSVGNVELTPTGICETGSGTMPAYTVDRYQQLLFDATASRTILGDTAGIRVSFRPQNDEIYSKTVLNYKFAELGCQWVDIIVEDANAGKTTQERVWFEVRNALPIMQNLTLQFPQSAQQQQVGVGAMRTSLSDEGLSLDTTLSSIVVKATVQGGRDPDGSISYYRWWYYPNNDDTRKEGFKITPAAISSVTFVIPKPGSPTEYSFVVEAVDNDGGRVSSEDILGKGPIVFFPPGEVQLDQPIVSLKVNTVNAKAGDEIAFNVLATIPSERPDFEATRIIKYDFDGDGIYDQTTKRTEMTYSYTKPGTYSPKVAVYYRDRAGVGLGEKITIVRGVTPRVLYAVHDRTVLVRNVTLGDVQDAYICMHDQACLSTGSTEPLYTGTSFVHTYSTHGEYLTKLAVIDAYGNELVKNDRLTISEQEGFGFLSIPEVMPMGSGGYEVSLGASMENTWTAYLVDEKNCYIDIDITVDSDGDGDPTLDTDYNCNELIMHKFTPTQKTQEGRLYRVVDGKVIEQPIVFNFLDIEEEWIPEGSERIAEWIDELLASLPVATSDVYIGYYKDMLKNLKGSLGDAAQKSSLIIQLRDLVGNYPHVVPTADKESLALLLSTLSDSTVQSAFGGTVYETEKNNILVRFQEPARSQVIDLFSQFEAAQGTQEEMKQHLDAIANLAATERSAGKIDETDFNYIRTSLCALINYYELPSKTCGAQDELLLPDQEANDTNNDESKSGSSVLSKILRVILVIVIILALVFGVLIVIFAIKAKKQQQQLTDSDTEGGA